MHRLPEDALHFLDDGVLLFETPLQVVNKQAGLDIPYLMMVSIVQLLEVFFLNHIVISLKFFLAICEDLQAVCV